MKQHRTQKMRKTSVKLMKKQTMSTLINDQQHTSQFEVQQQCPQQMKKKASITKEKNRRTKLTENKKNEKN